MLKKRKYIFFHFVPVFLWMFVNFNVLLFCQSFYTIAACCVNQKLSIIIILLGDIFIYESYTLLVFSFTSSHLKLTSVPFLFLCSCNCSPEWSGTLCTVRYDDCRNAGQDLCVHGTCIDTDRIVAGQVTSHFILYLTNLKSKGKRLKVQDFIYTESCFYYLSIAPLIGQNNT